MVSEYMQRPWTGYNQRIQVFGANSRFFLTLGIRSENCPKSSNEVRGVSAEMPFWLLFLRFLVEREPDEKP